MSDQLLKSVKQMVIFCLMALFITSLFSCGPRPGYKTLEGKRKLKYYNSIQFGGDAHPKKKF
jgi:hypothetical protein